VSRDAVALSSPPFAALAMHAGRADYAPDGKLRVTYNASSTLSKSDVLPQPSTANRGF